MKLRNHLDKYLPLYVALAMALGLYVGSTVNVGAYKGVLHWLNLVVVIAMIYPMMINLRVSELKNAVKQGKALAIGLVMGLVVAPLMMWGLIYPVSLLHPLPAQLSLGLMLAIVVPCSSMSIAYTGLSRGNIELATIIVAISFILAIVAVPGWLALYAASTHVSVPLATLIETIIEVVIVPMVLGIATRSYLLRRLGAEGFRRIRPLFPSISLIGMYSIVFLIFMEKARLIMAKPVAVAVTMLPLALYYAIALGLLTVADKNMVPYRDHMAIVFPSVGKNEGTAMAIALTAGMGLTAIAPAITPLLQIPFLVGYMKSWRRIATLWGCRRTEEAEEEQAQPISVVTSPRQAVDALSRREPAQTPPPPLRGRNEPIIDSSTGS